MAAKKIPLIWNNYNIRKNEKKNLKMIAKKQNRITRNEKLHDEIISCLQQLLDEKIHTHTLWTL